ncbi:MAG TPA: SUMF1/EgtB/PvdO family nonheme iron enzyme [Bryobacteraceae bacterium]|nr:SUMF1/EgtB/PvdO family nonheme iron enzyme [Bryobacteraceae bacterium]
MATGFAAELAAARSRTDELFELLSPEAVYDRPVPERHRLIFYLGHLEAFDWNLIARTTLDLPSFQPTFDRLFAFGIDPEPGKQPADKVSDWPSRAEVASYNARVRETLDRALGDTPSHIVQTAIEHRLMHAETFAYLMHNLPHDRKSPTAEIVGHSGESGIDISRFEMIEIPAGVVTLGQPREQFGWDNEFDEHKVEVPAFRISRYKVTNEDYLRFVREGARPPHFWENHSGEWFYRGMFSRIPLPLRAPVYVTQEEAAAYAKWAGKALPTEAQFHRAAFGTPAGDERSYPWSENSPIRGAFDFSRWDPADVDATPQTDSAFGVSQLIGNGWEWTSTVFGPFPGFHSFPFYPGYSQDFFDGEHYVVKGASPRTAARFLRRSFRNWFRPNYPYVYATFRLVDN